MAVVSAPWGAAAGPDPVHQELEEPGAVAVYARPRVADVVRTFACHPLNYAAGWMLELLDPPARPVLPDSNCSMTGGTASSAIFRVQQLPAHPVSQAWVRPEAIWDRSFRTTIFALLMVGRTLYHTVRRADPAKGQSPPPPGPPPGQSWHTHTNSCRPQISTPRPHPQPFGVCTRDGPYVACRTAASAACVSHPCPELFPLEWPEWTDGVAAYCA